MSVIQHPERLAGATFTHRAWWSLLGFVASFPLAFLVGEGLISALGYPTGGQDPVPWWAALVAVIPALVVFALPAAAAVYFGRRALRLGDAQGRLPIIVALSVAAGFVFLNGMSALAVWLLT